MLRVDKAQAMKHTRLDKDVTKVGVYLGRKGRRIILLVFFRA